MQKINADTTFNGHARDSHPETDRDNRRSRRGAAEERSHRRSAETIVLASAEKLNASFTIRIAPIIWSKHEIRDKAFGI